MAYLAKKGNNYYVVYRSPTSKKKVWVPASHSEFKAKKIMKEIEAQITNQTLFEPSNMQFSDFAEKWFNDYANTSITPATLSWVRTLIFTHIIPYFKNMELKEIKSTVCNEFYSSIRKKELKRIPNDQIRSCLSESTIHNICIYLKKMFEKAIEWKLLKENPVQIKTPKPFMRERNFWDNEIVYDAMNNMPNRTLRLAVHIAYICTLRIGEVCGLTWDNIHIDSKSIEVQNTLQRVYKSDLDKTIGISNVYIFPTPNKRNRSVLILKSPKNRCSIREVYITKKLANELANELKIQTILKETNLNYENHNLVLSQDNGCPIEPNLLEKWFKRFVNVHPQYNPITFHDIRSSSITHKLEISHGDYKTVQKDSGHSSHDILIKVYAKTNDRKRKNLINTLEQSFYINDMT